MPQFDFSTVASQVFWLLISFGFFYAMITWVILPRIENVLEDRQDRIDHDNDKAIELRAEADDVMRQYQLALQEAKVRSRKIMEEADEEIKEIAMQKHNALSQELAAETTKAESRIKSAKTKAMTEIKSVAQDIAVQAYEKLTGKSINGKSASNAIEAVSKEAA